MILRRINEHVRAQNWLAVSLDLVIVVAGVFFGIQLGNWNEARADQRRGEEYTRRLIADLERDYAAFRTLFAYYSAVHESVVRTDLLLSDPTSDPLALVTAAYRASEFNNNWLNQSTWEEIVSTGHIGLLANDAVESGLSNYYKFQSLNESGNARMLDSPYRQAVRSLIPLPVQLAIRSGCSDVVNPVQVAQGFVSECEIDVEPAVLAETADALRASPEVRQTLRYQYSLVAGVQVSNSGNLFLLDQVLSDLRTPQDVP